MEKISITFLGTSDSIPSKTRNHPAILLNYKKESILVDCGEGTQKQFKLANISPFNLTKVLITHWHGDHILGLPGLFQTLGMLNYNKKLKVYGPKGTENKMNAMKNLVNIEIPLEIHEVENKTIQDNEFLIETSSMSHTTHCNAYSFILKEKRRLDKSKLKKHKLPNSPILGQLQQGKDVVHNGKKIKASQVSYLEKQKKITFILDTALNQNAINLAKNSDLLIIESSFSENEKAQANKFRHLTAVDAATIAKKAKVKRLILTHISQRYEYNLSKIEKEAKKVFKSVSLAKDLQTITI